MNRIEYIEAHFKPIWKQVPVEVPTGEVKRGPLGGKKALTRQEKQWKQTGRSKSEIDGVRLGKDIENKVAELNSDGYEVVSITPLISGSFAWAHNTEGGGSMGGWGYGYGYGYSYTEGVVIVARKIA